MVGPGRDMRRLRLRLHPLVVLLLAEQEFGLRRAVVVLDFFVLGSLEAHGDRRSRADDGAFAPVFVKHYLSYGKGVGRHVL